MAVQPLTVRKLADKSEPRDVVFVSRSATPVDTKDPSKGFIVDPNAVERRLVNPATPGYDHEPVPAWDPGLIRSRERPIARAHTRRVLVGAAGPRRGLA